MKGILGCKVGMTQVFSKTGELTPVTVIEVEPNVVTQVKTKATDGYDAIQLAFSTKREKLSNKPEQGHVKKAKTTPKRFLREIRSVDINNYELGQEVKVDIFEAGEVVDVTGTSKGKGFQGVIKRHNQHIGPKSHGSHFHRSPGSMGTMRPKRVFKGKKLPGQMGGETVTIQNSEIVSVDLENNIILVKGNVPGPKKSFVIIQTSVKNPKKKNNREELISYIEEETKEQEPITDNSVEASIEIEEPAIEEPTIEEPTEEKVIEEPAIEEKKEETSPE